MNKKLKKKKTVKRFEPDISTGLTYAQVEQRQEEKLTNKIKNKNSKSYFEIFFFNIVNYFNLIWMIIFIALIWVGAYGDLFFIVTILCNTLISIIQEIKAKITVEKLSLVTAPRVKVIREGKEVEVFSDKIVLDDVIILSVGNQIPTDCVVLDDVKVEVNESLLTGESQAVKKNKGDQLLAGSFIISGKCYAHVNKIGKDSYIQSVASEAKKYKSPNSNLTKDLNWLIKYIGMLIIPVASLMLINNYFAYSKDMALAIQKTCGSLTGMIPAGMYLLITIALTLSVIKLANKKTLVQEMYSIEMLARTNVLCLDKTGTITDGTMNVKEFIVIDKKNMMDYETLMQNMLGAQPHNNSTANALIEFFGRKTNKKVVANIPFSSQRKYFATEFLEGTFVLGAPEFCVPKINKELQGIIDEKTENGTRVLMLGRTDYHIKELPDSMLPGVEPLALICIEDHIRPDATQTIQWFKDNGVAIKIISGDNPATVANIARRVGVENAEKCVSLDGLSLTQVANIADKFTIFGRVSPEQKHTLIKTLKTKGYVVAMTGDGVNDTLALKEADCSIAMADGSEVARNISDIVLMDSKFSSLPAVVKEGRQVVNNVQQSSTLFLMKTVFTIGLSLITLITLSPYPFSPKQLMLIELFVIGLPSVLLAIQPNDALIKGEFISTVLKRAIPRGIFMLVTILIITFLGRVNAINPEEVATLSTLLLTFTGYINLILLCLPLTKLKTFCLSVSGFLIIFTGVLFNNLFGITAINYKTIMIFTVIIGASVVVACFLGKIEEWLKNLFKKMLNK